MDKIDYKKYMERMTSGQSTREVIDELIELGKKELYKEIEKYIAFAKHEPPTYDTFLDGVNQGYQNILDDFKPKS